MKETGKHLPCQSTYPDQKDKEVNYAYERSTEYSGENLGDASVCRRARFSVQWSETELGEGEVVFECWL